MNTKINNSNNQVIHSIGIIGSGNVAWHLAQAIHALPQLQIAWIYSRNQETLSELGTALNCEIVTSLPQQKVDLILICVNDDNIQAIVNQLPKDASIAYTSGVVTLNELSFQQSNFGVFYPLQTFTRKKDIALKDIPFLIEATNEAFTIQLEQLAKQLSSNVQRISSEQRKQLHVAAVFTNNFVNHLLYLAQQHLKQNKLDEHLLQPLLKETIAKVTELGPFQAQSGPARRNDLKTIETHKQQLEGIAKTIYSTISESIIKTYHS
ncbi:MAG: DUF2520 domain-containing protein [Crocinitomicaceae bacterium]|nr:DUF2520 domain-containing protein [Crocinitomicaceae bacterium]